MNRLALVDTDLAKLITHSGSASFGGALVDSMQKLAHCDHCTFIEYDYDYSAKTLVSNGAIDATLAIDCAKIYDANLYRLDPNFEYVRGLKKNGESLVKQQFRRDMINQEYRSRLFDRCHVQEKVTVLFKTSNNVLSLNLYRLNSSSFSTPLQLDWTKHNSNLLISILQKHVELNRRSRGSSFDRDWIERRLTALFPKLLTEREREVCLHIVLGSTSEMIAHNLDISINTVLTHRRNAYEKLSICTQNQLFCLLVEGLLLPQ